MAERRVVQNLVDFFKTNPDEELTIMDAALKFGLEERTAGSYLSYLSGKGVIERVSIYRLKEHK